MIHIHVALPCEAKPLLQTFGLRRDHKTGLFSHYLDSRQELSLCISGIGKINAAAALMESWCRYHKLYQGNPPILLNIGSSGHKYHAQGKAFIAGRIIDPTSKQLFYPQFAFKPPFPIAELTTIDKPSTSYGDTLIDMEAIGFYTVASRISIQELSHCIKIVSDNRECPTHTVSAKLISKLIGQCMDRIMECIHQLRKLQQSIHRPDIGAMREQLMVCAHFSASQRNQLETLLLRWQALLPEQSPVDFCTTLQGSGKQRARHIIRRLNERLDTHVRHCEP